MTATQAQMDAALGTLAATAAGVGCPPDQVQRMCDTSEFTRGLDTAVLSGSVSGTVGGTTWFSGTGATGPGGGEGAGIGDLVTTVSGVVEGFAGGVPGQGLCGDRDALVAADAGWQAAVGSLESCAGAVDNLTSGCVQAVSALVDTVCGLAGPALACGSAGAGALAGELVGGAVDAVTGMLEQRNRGLGALVDITVGDCTTAAEVTGTGCPSDTGEPGHPGTVPDRAMEPVPQPEGECPQQATDPGCPEQTREPEPAQDRQEPGDDAPGEAVVTAEPVEQEETGAGASGSVDPVHGFDKTGRGPVDDAPTVLSAGAGEDGADGPGEGTAPVDSSWDPDLWVTAGDPAGGADQSLPETAGAW